MRAARIYPSVVFCFALAAARDVSAKSHAVSQDGSSVISPRSETGSAGATAAKAPAEKSTATGPSAAPPIGRDKPTDSAAATPAPPGKPADPAPTSPPARDKKKPAPSTESSPKIAPNGLPPASTPSRAAAPPATAPKPEASAAPTKKSEAPQKPSGATDVGRKAETSGAPKASDGTRRGEGSVRKSPPASPEGAREAPVPTSPPVVSGPAESPGPGAGQGERKIRQSERSDAEALGATKKSDASVALKKPDSPARESAGTAHRLGKAPKHPISTLPDGAAPGPTDDDARRQIVGGPTADDLAAAKPDAELREMREAERALFPKPLYGARVGWSWDLPAPLDDGSPTVVASGLPPGFQIAPDERSTSVSKEAEFVKTLTLPNLPTRLDARVLKYLQFYRDDARGRNILRTWAKKCGRFVPALRAELAKAGLPTDLVWLSLIESGHNPTIVSPVGAAGLWQFMPESGRLYGLTVDRWVDERLDPERATVAAVRYLNDLRSRFGSWELAMAAYNMGHGGLLRAVRKFNTNDFWALSRYEAGIPWETTLYVPKILATAVVMANKKAFGIDDIEQDAPISFDTVQVASNVDLADIARAADVSLEDVRALNAQYLSGRTPPVTEPTAAGSPPRRYPVRVPAGRGLVTEQRLAANGRRPGPAMEPHVVRFGDTLETIAAEHGAAARDIAQQNHVGADERLLTGSVLLVPSSPSGGSTTVKDVDEEVVVVPGRRFVESNRKRVFYKVLPGDQVGQIASAFGVSPSEVGAWNAIDPVAELQPGMTLQVLVRPEFDLSRVRCLAEHEVKLLVAGSAEFFDFFEAQNGRKRLTVTAKKGDTYAVIGRRYGMSTSMMERINRIPAVTPLNVGDRVVVYTKGEAGAGVTSDVDLARELAAISAPFPEALPPLPSTAANAAPNGHRTVLP
jgi:membrane-bound lytic murein transglycosylase D